MPLLEVVTRHHTGRPKLLARNQASLGRQTDKDWHHTLLVDDVGRGVPWANDNLASYEPLQSTRYVWVLDDDDICTSDQLVADLREIVESDLLAPDVIMVRVNCHRFGILPDPWLDEPKFSRVCMSNFVVRRDIWLAHRAAFAGGLGADYRFIRSIWDADPWVSWLDAIAAAVPAASWGAAE